MRFHRHLIIIALFCLPFFSYAQITPTEQVSLTPSYPAPGDEVTATLNTYASQFSGASITWRIDGALLPEGANQKEVTFTAGEAGKPMKLTTTLVLVDGSQQTLETTITPLYVDIIVEPQTRVPDFYLGRALPSFGSMVNATVIVDTGTVSTDTYIYSWRLNNEPLFGGPLRGQSRVSFETPRGSQMVLSVTVSTLSGTVLTQKNVSIKTMQPQLVFYEVSSLYGILPLALSRTHYLIGDNLSLVAEPYYLDSRIYNNPDVARWKIGSNAPSENNGNPYRAILERTGETGETTVSFEVQDDDRVLQGNRAGITIKY